MPDLQASDRSGGEFLPAIRRGRIQLLTIHEVTEVELERLEEGSSATLLLTFSLFCLSSAVSFFISLLTTTMTDRVFIVFVVFTVVGAALGLVLLFIWLQKRRSVSALLEEIRRRAPPEGVQEKT